MEDIILAGLMNQVYIYNIIVKFSFFAAQSDQMIPTYSYLLAHEQREQPYVTATDVFITELRNLNLNALNSVFCKSSWPFRDNLICTSWSIE